MFLEPVSHFVSWYYLINTLTLCVYLPLRESHHGNNTEQGWFGMSRETEMCFLFVLLMGKKIKYVVLAQLSTLKNQKSNPCNTAKHRHSLDFFKPSFSLERFSSRFFSSRQIRLLGTFRRDISDSRRSLSSD